MAAEGDQARVFFALWPTPPLRDQLARRAALLHAHHGGRIMGADSLHLTLVFVGQVPGARLVELVGLGGRIRNPPFDLSLDRIGCWRHNRIACLEAGLTPAPLLDLVRNLESALGAAGFDFDRRTYHPHVTLLRNADCLRSSETAAIKNPAPEAVAWPARDFVLVRSSRRPDGARYQELGRWPLL